MRLIHLPDSDNRSELMIIYLEALEPGQLPPGATNETTADPSPQLAALVLRHAREGLRIARLP